MEDAEEFKLYADPSFLEGIARLVDVGNALNEYNNSSDGEEADARAIQSDWESVGRDIRLAVQKLERELAEGKTHD